MRNSDGWKNLLQDVHNSQTAEKLKKELAQNIHDSESSQTKGKNSIGKPGQGLDDGVSEEMCDIAMHQNIIDAYNYHMLEYMKATGMLVSGLNYGRDYEYWEEYIKKTVAILFSEKYTELSEHFMEFLDDRDRFKTDNIVNAIKQYAPGERGWEYWRTLARWKVAERVLTTGYSWNDYSEVWYSNDEPFDLREALKISNSEYFYSQYTIEERRKCADIVKVLFMEAERNMPIPVEKEQTGALEHMAMNDLFANSDYNAMKEEMASLKKALEAVTNEREEANKKLAVAEAKVAEYEKADSERKPIEHDQLVGDIFSEIAQRYMECTKNKDVAGRKDVKRNLRDIMDELKLHNHITKDIQRCISHFDDKETPVIPQVIIQEVVLEKHVDYQVNGVAAGATGVSVNHKPKKQ